jgi:hypothetical protein
VYLVGGFCGFDFQEIFDVTLTVPISRRSYLTEILSAQINYSSPSQIEAHHSIVSPTFLAKSLYQSALKYDP